MLITRWQAPQLPSIEQIKIIFRAEDLEARQEEYAPGEEVSDHRHKFDEVRMVVSGSLGINVAGNQLVLHPGDKIEIPSNTRHSTKNISSNEHCVCIFAQRTFKII